MNSGPILFLSAFVTLAASFWGLIVVPQLQLGRQDLRPIPPMDQLYPSGRLGLAKQGADVYRSLGCVECHTQQVRPAGFGADLERGWGVRRTVAQDFLRDEPVQLGSLRMGPDLANVGSRLPDRQWHLDHLYHPKSRVQGSTMPRYTYLFETRPIVGTPSPGALRLEDEFAAPDGYEIVPTEKAEALVAYLVSLQSDAPLFEAPLPPSPAEGETNNAPPTAVSDGVAPEPPIAP